MGEKRVAHTTNIGSGIKKFLILCPERRGIRVQLRDPGVNRRAKIIMGRISRSKGKFSGV